jgi:sugar phosphate isomerase/epimerase
MNPDFAQSGRRNFLKSTSAALVASTFATRASAAEPAKSAKLFSSVGIASKIANANLLKAAGAEFLTESVGDFLVPDQTEAQFEKNLASLAESPLPILACNGFIRPTHLRCVGPEANHDAILAWSEIAFRRLRQARGKFIVFGSGTARQLRDGWPKEKADAQFISLLQRMGPLAASYGVTVTLEQLQAEECNYINHLAEGAEIIRAAKHPNIRLLADLYHMASMGDTPAELKAAMDVVAHLEIAEKEGRTAPGIQGDDFRPFFKVLKDSGYSGAISIEGKWQDQDLPTAFQEIAKQASQV